jgi:hypothetical protein
MSYDVGESSYAYELSPTIRPVCAHVAYGRELVCDVGESSYATWARARRARARMRRVEDSIEV